ncbi:MAG: glycosyl hydrolase family 18 protein [Bacteroidota bacterium]
MTRILTFLFVLISFHGFSQSVSIHREEQEHYNSLGISADQYQQQNMPANMPATDRGGCTLNKVVYGWHPYWSNGLQTNYNWNLLSHLCYFSYEVDANTGNAITTHSFSTTQVVTDALNNGVRVDLCVTLFSNHATFLGNATSRQTLITNLINLIQSRGAHGVNIDFEGLPVSQKTNFRNFMNDLANQMHAAIPGSQVSTVLYAVDWNDVFDIPNMTAVDYFIIMGYDYYWTGSSNAGPNDPLFHFGTTYNYTLSKSVTYYLDKGVPASKLVVGLPYYGREWPVSSSAMGAATTGSGTARTYSYIKNNSTGFYTPANRNHDDESVSTYYTFNNAGWRQCFISEEYDLGKRMDFINKRGIAGMGIWALGYDDGYNQFWNEIQNYFTNCASDNCSDTLYDIGGGIFKNYYDNEDYTFTIAPPNAQNITVNFTSFNIEASWDYLYIHNGPGTASPQIPGSPFTGTTSPGTFTSTGGALTFHFTSDGSTVAPGFTATYTCTIDNNPPSTSISPDNVWKTQDFNATFTDTDNESGVNEKYWQVLDNNGTEWRANPQHGFFNDNFDNAIHPDWTNQTGVWAINSQRLNQSDEAQANSNLWCQLTQNNSYTYLYHWQANMGGTGTNRRSGLHFFVDDPTLPNRGNSYFVYFRVDSDKCQIYEVVNDVFTLMTDNDVTIDPATWYDFKVTYTPATGNIKCYANDNLVSEWTDTSPLQTGNYLSLRSGGTNVLYDDVKVYRSRSNPETVSIGTASDMVRYQNSNPSSNSCRIKSIVNDNANNWSAPATSTIHIDWTTPSNTTLVNDGTGTDVDTITDNTQLQANWALSTDPHSGIAYYEVAAGVSPGDSGVVAWTNNGPGTSATLTGLFLAYGQTYYISVRAVNGAGLVSSATNSDGAYLVTPSSPPVASFSNTNNEVCVNDSVQFVNSSQNSTSFLWSFPGGSPSSSTLNNPKVKYPANGSYTVTLTANGPGGTDNYSSTINVSLYNPPVSSFSVNDTILYLPNAFLAATNTSTDANAWVWDFGDGNGSADENPWTIYDSAGTYTVQLVASNGICEDDTSWITVNVMNTISVNEISGEIFSAWPNPFDEQIIISLPPEESRWKFTITDISGKIVFTQTTFAKEKIILQVSQLAKGTYLLIAENEEKKQVKKMVK